MCILLGRIAAIARDSSLLLYAECRRRFVCLSLCVGHVREPCKNSWTDRDAVWGTDSCGPKEPCIMWGLGRTNPFAAARGDKTAMQPFIKFFDHLISTYNNRIVWLFGQGRGLCARRFRRAGGGAGTGGAGRRPGKPKSRGGLLLLLGGGTHCGPKTWPFFIF